MSADDEQTASPVEATVTAPSVPEAPSSQASPSVQADGPISGEPGPDPADASASKRHQPKLARPYRIYGGLIIVYGGLTFIARLVIAFFTITLFLRGRASEVVGGMSASIVILSLAAFSLSFVLSALYVILGARLLRNERRHAGTLAYTMIALTVLSLLLELMLTGVDISIFLTVLNIVVLIIISAYVDPALAQERQLQGRLRDLEYREQAEAGGRDVTGEGFITLNFFNLFWIFTITCVIGLIVEDIYHAIVFGGYEDRAGLLYGPFSPIYGLGGVLLTIALNRFYNKNPLIIFAVSAIIGGAFEYFVSWFMQMSFGITAWDYSGPWFNADGSINPVTFMNINGRTSLLFMIFWGLLGLVWIRSALPAVLRLVNLIPWNVRYAVTTVAAVLLISDGALTLISLDCWYERVAGHEPTEPIELFCAEYYDNDFMQNRFQTMTIDPSAAQQRMS